MQYDRESEHPEFEQHSFVVDSTKPYTRMQLQVVYKKCPHPNPNVDRMEFSVTTYVVWRVENGRVVMREMNHDSRQTKSFDTEKQWRSAVKRMAKREVEPHENG